MTKNEKTEKTKSMTKIQIRGGAPGELPDLRAVKGDGKRDEREETLIKSPPETPHLLDSNDGGEK